MENLGFEGLGCSGGGFAVCFGHGFGVAQGLAGGGAKDTPDGPGAVRVRKEELAMALLFLAVVPAAEERKMVGEAEEVGVGGGLGGQCG